LLAQKIGLFAPVSVVVANDTGAHLPGQIGLLPMDVGLIAAIVMLVLWAAGTFFLDAPGWITLLLTAGVFLLIWRVTVRTAGSTKETRSK
jgi:hypothetical protein